jgi:HD-GYP domain-containing protein (c-di-GMP phosphodiesterase class II)
MEGFEPQTLNTRLEEVHGRICAEMPGVRRIGIALHDEKTGHIRTFAHSTVGPPPFERSEASLADSASLEALAASHGVRVIDDIAAIPGDSATFHSRSLVEKGFRSSLTRPFYSESRLVGFLFFDAAEPGYFTEGIVQRLGVFSDHLALLVLHSLELFHVLDASLQTGSLLTRFRDHETASHVQRVALYARRIASVLAPTWGLTDEWIEYLARFTVAHDIGKLAVPERILFKAGSLSVAETEIMKSHSLVGTAIVDGLVGGLALQRHAHIALLRNIVRHHHEHYDGSGYPDGLAGGAIPMEARIVTVADVYDALRCERTYKNAWTADDVLSYVKAERGVTLDPECVDAFLSQADDLEEIGRLAEEPPRGR